MFYTFDQVYDYIKSNRLDYWDRKEELEWLHDITKRWCYSHPNAHINILEIGTYCGVTALCMATGMDGTNIYNLTTVDKCLFEKPENIIAKIEKFNKDLDLFVEFVEKDDIAYVKSLGNKSIDLLYIDTLHTLEHMTVLLDKCLPKIKHGGLLFGHDYSPEFSGVVEAVSNFRNDNKDRIIGSGQDYSIWWSLIKDLSITPS